MVSWDGTVKILGFGISMMSAFAAQAPGAAPEVLHYMSPEQLRGDPLGAPSNIFSLGAIFYEMVTERKAFDGEDADQVRRSISEMTPVAPDQINRKLHPALSEVIMKALAKAPEERYQSGQDLVNDLERCKESATKAAAAAKPGQPAQKAPTPQKPARRSRHPNRSPQLNQLFLWLKRRPQLRRWRRLPLRAEAEQARVPRAPADSLRRISIRLRLSSTLRRKLPARLSPLNRFPTRQRRCLRRQLLSRRSRFRKSTSIR